MLGLWPSERQRNKEVEHEYKISSKCILPNFLFYELKYSTEMIIPVKTAGDAGFCGGI